MELAATFLKFLVPGIAGGLLSRGLQAAQIIMTAFGGDEVRREAEIAVMISELNDGKIPNILEKVIA